MMKVTARMLGKAEMTEKHKGCLQNKDISSTKKWQQQGQEPLQRQGIIGEPKAAGMQETVRTLTSAKMAKIGERGGLKKALLNMQFFST
jgi:hypothetical protein